MVVVIDCDGWCVGEIGCVVVLLFFFVKNLGGFGDGGMVLI